MRYVLDTNILLHYLRQTEKAVWIDKIYNPLDTALHEPIFSVVSVGEIRTIAKMNAWGEKKLAQLELILDELIIADINAYDVIERYAEIDAFSQGKLVGRPLNTSSRNMGKNDLWIAATTSVLHATLLTTDLDFNHLHKEFLLVEYIP